MTERKHNLQMRNRSRITSNIIDDLHHNPLLQRVDFLTFWALFIWFFILIRCCPTFAGCCSSNWKICIWRYLDRWIFWFEFSFFWSTVIFNWQWAIRRKERLLIYLQMKEPRYNGEANQDQSINQPIRIRWTEPRYRGMTNRFAEHSSGLSFAANFAACCYLPICHWPSRVSSQPVLTSSDIWNIIISKKICFIAMINEHVVILAWKKILRKLDLFYDYAFWTILYPSNYN